jgi:flagellar hook assembly protein FlgD
VQLQVFDLNGRLVRTLVSQPMPAGHHEATWDGAGEGGRREAPGLYLYRIHAGAFEGAGRTVLIP